MAEEQRPEPRQTVMVPGVGLVDVGILLEENTQLKRDLQAERQASAWFDSHWTPTLPGTAPQLPAIDETYINRQIRFSTRAFGPGSRQGGVSDHIRKELDTEVCEGTPEEDPKEWIDVLMLAIDGAWRSGLTAQQIIGGLREKLAINETRTWPDWRTAEPGKAIEHDRSAEAASHDECLWNDGVPVHAADCPQAAPIPAQTAENGTIGEEG